MPRGRDRSLDPTTTIVLDAVLFQSGRLVPTCSVRATAGSSLLRHKHVRRNAADLGRDAVPRGVHAHAGWPHLCWDYGGCRWWDGTM